MTNNVRLTVGERRLLFEIVGEVELSPEDLELEVEAKYRLRLVSGVNPDIEPQVTLFKYPEAWYAEDETGHLFEFEQVDLEEVNDTEKEK